MRCRAIHSLSEKGRSSSDPDQFQPYDEVDDTNAIYSVSRENLNNLLIDTVGCLARIRCPNTQRRSCPLNCVFLGGAFIVVNLGFGTFLA
jgi:hypothetical protein